MACGKIFRSEAAWDSHERSRKHLKAVDALKRQMEQEHEDLGLDAGTEGREEGDEDEGLGQEEEEEEDMYAATEEPPAAFEKSLPEPDVEEHEPSLPTSKGKGKKGKSRVTRAPSPEVTTKTDKRPRKRDVVISDVFADAEPPSAESANGTPEPEEQDLKLGPTKREKRRAKEAAKKAAAENKIAESVVRGHMDPMMTTGHSH